MSSPPPAGDCDANRHTPHCDTVHRRFADRRHGAGRSRPFCHRHRGRRHVLRCAGGFEPLRLVPKGKIVVLGLVTTKTGQLESRDELKRRIEEASQYVDIDQLCLSPQCGFSSTFEGNALTYDQQVAKLRLIVETAREVWG
jgi:hypothetical protein